MLWTDTKITEECKGDKMDCIKENGNECYAFVTKDCSTCRFSITAEQAFKRLNKRNKRLQSLPADQQRKIAKKYFGGVAEW